MSESTPPMDGTAPLAPDPPAVAGEPAGNGDAGWIARVLDRGGEWVWEIDRLGVHRRSSPTVEALLGWRPEEILGRAASEFIHEEDRARAGELIDRAVADRAGWTGVVLRWRHRSGGVRWLESTAEPVLDGDGAVRGFRGVDRDVTVRVRTEKVLREAFSLAANERARVESILTALAEGISIQDRDYRVLYQNPTHVGYIGAHKGELCYRAYEGREEVCEGCPVARTFADGGVHRELRVLGEGESRRHFEITAAPLRDAAGELVAGIEAVRDVTAEWRTAEALRCSEERFRELADSLPEMVFETDREGRITYVNRAGIEMFGYAPEEVSGGLSLLDLVVPGDRAAAAEHFASRLRGERHGSPEYRVARRDGSTFPALIQGEALLREGKPAGVRGVLIDITERKVIEAERLRTEKMESIGVLAGGIAHDFNNILTAILGNISMLKRRFAADGEALRRIDEAERASLHARDLTQQLLTFARGGAPVRQPLRIGPALAEPARLALRGASARLELELPEALPTVEADAGQVAQVVQNLVINAAQSMPSGGLVRLAAAAVTVSDGDPLPLPPGRYVRFSVEDHGAGIPAEMLPRIFDPYFTTKPRGTGLGLAVSYSVVRAHGGHIEVSSTPGRGTKFTVYLPASDLPVREAPPDREPPAPPERARVLVMDDEPMVREVAAAILGDNGWEVRAVADGAEAVRCYREALGAGAPFDVVIMDLTIPGGMGGIEALNALREVDPGVRAVVSSGYSNDPVMAEYERHGFVGVVVKPYRARDLMAAVQGALAAPRAGEG